MIRLFAMSLVFAGCSAIPPSDVRPIEKGSALISDEACHFLAAEAGDPSIAAKCPSFDEVAAAVVALTMPSGASTQSPPRFISAKDIGQEIVKERKAKQ